MRKRRKPGSDKDSKNLTKKYEHIAESRNLLLELQKTFMENENSRKIKEHEYIMENLKLQRMYIENEEKRKQEEHSLKLKL